MAENYQAGNDKRTSIRRSIRITFKVSDKRIVDQQIILVTATDFEELISIYDFGQFLEICRRALTTQYSGFTLRNVANECTDIVPHDRGYPLVDELERLVGVKRTQT